MVDMIPVRSSSIESIGYDQDARALHVRFLESGATYVYLDVERAIFQAFVDADSKGQFFVEQLRDMYSYRRLE